MELQRRWLWRCPVCRLLCLQVLRWRPQRRQPPRPAATIRHQLHAGRDLRRGSHDSLALDTLPGHEAAGVQGWALGMLHG